MKSKHLVLIANAHFRFFLPPLLLFQSLALSELLIPSWKHPSNMSVQELALNKYIDTYSSDYMQSSCGARLIGVKDHSHALHLKRRINIPSNGLALRDDWCVSVALVWNRAGGDTGAAVSENACLNNTELHLRPSINKRQTTQLLPALITVFIFVFVTADGCIQNMQMGNNGWMVVWTAFEMLSNYVFTWLCGRYWFLIAL